MSARYMPFSLLALLVIFITVCPAFSALVSESWESSDLQAVFDGSADVDWYGDTADFAIEGGDWPDGLNIFGSSATRAIRSTNASQSVAGRYTIVTDITDAIDPELMTQWSVYVSGNSISIQSGYWFSVVLVANTTDTSLIESPNLATQGFLLTVSARTVESISSDYLTLWKSSASDNGWIALGQVNLGSAWLNAGWNILVTRRPNGEMTVSHATGTKGVDPVLDFTVSDTTVYLSGANVYGGASWATKGSSHANKFGFDDFNVESVLPPNIPPVADAGSDMDVTDSDTNGTEQVTFDATASSDADGEIVSWTWRENGQTLATGETPTIELAIGPHTLTLEVQDDGGAVDSDEITVNVYPGEPVADAGDDIVVRDADGSGSEPVTLDGSGSSYGRVIVSWIWSANGTLLATGVSPTVTLDVGVHEILLTVTDSEGLSDTDTVEVSVNPVGPTTLSISQYDITWTFATPVEFGQFVNGDYWVIGPVTIESVSPAPADDKHGSMLNPSIGDGQAYDIHSNNYSAAAGVVYPITLSGNNSLVSTLCWTDTAETHLDLTGHNISVSRIRAAAVLTVLDAVPAADAFRPPYSGTDKTIFRVSDINMDLLPRLTPPSEDPDYDYENAGIFTRDPGQTVAAQYSRLYQRPWLLHLSDWSGRSIHPTDNMPSYHREVYNTVAVGAALLLCDLDDIEDLLIPYLQLGIDSYGVIATGSGDDSSDADSSINKWPVLLAGLLLDDEVMKSNNYRYRTRWMSYYIEDGVSPYTSTIVPEGYTYNGYTVGWRQDPGTQEHEHLDPETEWVLVSDGGGSKRESYRRINSHTWPGICLAAHMSGAVDQWSDEAFFDYVDRWMSEEEYFPERSPHVGSTSSGLITAMWQQYRYAGGDFDADGDCDAADIDMLSEAVRTQQNLHFDLTGDGSLDAGDMDHLVTVILDTSYGDANLDGRVNLDDFIILKQNYGTQGSWQQGNMNSDTTVNLDDFILLKQNYGFSR